jgi:hypothetical protein
MRQLIFITFTLLLTNLDAFSQTIQVSPSGVNVNPNTPTTVFLTYAQLRNHRPAEARWCGEVIPAAPDLGFKCHPATIFGSLPARFDQSQRSGNQAFTDVMSIPQSVARRAYQAAAAGEDSRFFYIRRFINTADGPDEFVGMTCRLGSGGARAAGADRCQARVSAGHSDSFYQPCDACAARQSADQLQRNRAPERLLGSRHARR